MNPDVHSDGSNISRVYLSKNIFVSESERVRDLINTLELPLHTGTVEWKLKHLYEACLDVDNVNSDDARLLLDIISELGECTSNQNLSRAHSRTHKNGMVCLNFGLKDRMGSIRTCN